MCILRRCLSSSIIHRIMACLTFLVGWLNLFNATFNNISASSWWRKSEYPGKTTDLSQVTDNFYHIMLTFVKCCINAYALSALLLLISTTYMNIIIRIFIVFCFSWCTLYSKCKSNKSTVALQPPVSTCCTWLSSVYFLLLNY